MKEGHPASVGARNGRFVDQSKPSILQSFQVFLDVVDAEADVMNPLATLFNEPADWRIGRYGLEQLDIRVADREEGSLHALRVDCLDVIDVEAEGAIDLRRFNRADGDADVVKDWFVHWTHQTPRASA